MKVTTLGNEAFADACRRLEAMTMEFNPDLIVGIATGGEVVARGMYTDVPHVSVTARRPTTAIKSRCGALWKVIRRLPVWMRDAMRVAEAAIYNNRKGPLDPIIINDSRREAIAPARRILIVDDAIDSGVTMQRVLEAVRRIAPGASVATAVINVTTRRHLVEPDYRLYADRRLVRFPWSKDFTETNTKS